MKRLRIAVLASMCALFGGSVTACRTASPFEESEVREGVRVEVKNENIYEMDIYAVADGVATRVGTVGGLKTSSFSLNNTFFSASDFRIVATPFGGNGRASTGPIVVHDGNTIEFTVRSSLRASTVAIR